MSLMAEVWSLLTADNQCVALLKEDKSNGDWDIVDG